MWPNTDVRQFLCFLRETITSLENICHNSAIDHSGHLNSFLEIGNIGVYTKIDVHLEDNHQTYLGEHKWQALTCDFSIRKKMFS